MSEPLLGKIWDIPGLTLHQKAFLFHVIYNPKITCTQLAKKISCRRDSLPGIADSLTNAGYLSNIKTNNKGRNNYVPLKDNLEQSWSKRVKHKGKQEDISDSLVHSQEESKMSQVTPLPAASDSFTHSRVTPLSTPLIEEIVYKSTSTVSLINNSKEELIELSGKKADPDILDTLLKKYKTPPKQVFDAISLVNELEIGLKDYNKLLNVACYQLSKNKLTYEQAKQVVSERLPNEVISKPASARGDLSIEDIVSYGINYNISFGQPYGLLRQYAHAAEALKNAGVIFEIR